MYNHQLDTFVQVADAGSFSRAGATLFISPTAVMKQIDRLEEALEVRLFDWTPRGLTLTNAGKSYYQDAKYMIQYAKDAQTRAKNAMQDNGSMIRMGSSLMTPCQFLMDLWPDVHAAALELVRVPICCAVSIYHPLAQKKRLSVEDLHGQKLMLMKRNWSKYTDQLRDELWVNHPEIEIVDFSFYNLEAFNRCEHDNVLMMAVPQWAGVHPLLKILPVDWGCTIPFGLLHSPTPTDTVQRFLQTMQQVFPKTCQCE